jgi:Icc-related predicted phosphoesterase
MSSRLGRWFWCAAFYAIPAQAQEAAPPKPGSWEAFADERRAECDGPRGELDPPIELSAGGHRYRLHGHRLVQLDQDPDQRLRIGVISAIKDDREETLVAVRALLRRLQKEGIDVLVANGDLATNEFQMDTVFPVLAEAGVLVVATIGNTESCGSFNRAAFEVHKKSPNFINGNWVRRLELDDATLLTLPGYYNRPFVHTGGAAVYNAEDLDELRRLAKDAPTPRVLISHGPPQMSGKKALDVTLDAGNVGDPQMTELIKDLKINFGISGHILEAGGRGTDLSGKQVRAPKKLHPTLFVNAGTANPDPWGMLDGSTSYGMGLWVEIAGKKARYQVERLPQPR